MKKEQIYYINYEDIINKEVLKKYIYPNLDNNYYWSDNFDAKFYIQLAKAGFITVTYKADDKIILLPEIQREYAILDFENLKIPKKVKKLLDKNIYKFSINKHFNEVLSKIKNYHQDSWVEEKYIKLLNEVKNLNSDEFSLITVELTDKDNKLIAGEIGYMISKTYTSLTGFFVREKEYNNCGKLQLILLANYLKDNEFAFWNLGHPYMEYKYDLGAKIYDRTEFLYRWYKAINNN